MTGRQRDPFQHKVVPAQRRLGWWISAEDLRRMWESQSGLCALTGQAMDLATATLDHIVPRARGGSSELDNLRWTTKAANQAKGNMLDHEFIELCRKVVAHNQAAAEPAEDTTAAT